MNEFWTQLETEALKAANSMEDTAEVALSILCKMRGFNNDVIVQICGPMSTGGLGSLELNMFRFNRAIDVAQNNGIIVFNQVPFQEAMIRIAEQRKIKGYFMDILEVFYRQVFESGLIKKGLFLPDWQSSVGASWERELMLELGIIVEEYPSEWL